MRRGPFDDRAAAPGPSAAACPFHGGTPDSLSTTFDRWLERDLRCSAGKREFQLGRYTVARVKNGYQFLDAIENFRMEVEDHEKTGFLAIVPTKQEFANAAEELRHLGDIIVDAGFAESAGALIAGETVAIPFDVECPVTGLPTRYEFFPVAFCRHAARVADPLYDPSLSTPFLAINTTSDAFAFAMLVKDLSQKHFGCAPYEIVNRQDFDRLLARCTTVWQNMSVNTITGYNRVAEVSARAVHLSEDRRSWIAPHNDPVFAELEKKSHSHEMPVVYAERLCQKWTAALFEGARYAPGRDGQSGGIPAFDFRISGNELHQL